MSLSIPLFNSVIEPSGLRAALGHDASGITVITSQFDGEPPGFTCSSFYSVSISPPLVSFTVMGGSASDSMMRQVGRFAVNNLSDEKVKISRRSARRGADLRSLKTGQIYWDFGNGNADGSSVNRGGGIFGGPANTPILMTKPC